MRTALRLVAFGAIATLGCARAAFHDIDGPGTGGGGAVGMVGGAGGGGAGGQGGSGGSGGSMASGIGGAAGIAGAGGNASAGSSGSGGGAGTARGGTGEPAGSGGAAGGGGRGGTGAQGGSGGQAGAFAPTFSVVRVGDGRTALSSDATAVSVEERRPDGSLVRVVVLPTDAAGTNHPLTVSGSATSEGALSLSGDLRFLLLAGYAAPPGTGSIASTSAVTAPRLVGRIDSAGNVDTSTLVAGAFDGNNIRAATSVDGTGFWAAGAGAGTGGVWFVMLGATSAGVHVLASPNTVRCLGVFGGQLFATSSSGAFANVFSIGSGAPMTAGQAPMSLAGMPTSGSHSPFAFAIFDRDPSVPGLDTLYLADDQTPPDGGLQKWVSNGTTWTLAASLNLATGPVGFRGVAGIGSPGTVTLMATTADAVANRLVVFVDDGVTVPAGVVVASSPPSTAFRGVAPSPR